jgi:hypothetical protein
MRGESGRRAGHQVQNLVDFFCAVLPSVPVAPDIEQNGGFLASLCYYLEFLYRSAPTRSCRYRRQVECTMYLIQSLITMEPDRCRSPFPNENVVYV